MTRLPAVLGFVLAVAVVRAAWVVGGLIGSAVVGEPWWGHVLSTAEAVGVAMLAATAFHLAREREERRS